MNQKRTVTAMETSGLARVLRRGIAAALILTSVASAPVFAGGDVGGEAWVEKLECGFWECLLRSCPDNVQHDVNCHGNRGECYVGVSGPEFTGGGFAADASFMCDITVQAATEGWEEVTCEYYAIEDPTCRGRAKVQSTAVIDGKVDLEDPDCTAAALGWVELTSNLHEDLLVKLQTSQGSTVSAPPVATLFIPLPGGGTLTINITDGLQSGTRSDHSTDTITAQKVTNFFTRKIRCRGDAFLWANGGWAGLDTASSRIDTLEGEGKVIATLTEVRGSAPLH